MKEEISPKSALAVLKSLTETDARKMEDDLHCNLACGLKLQFAKKSKKFIVRPMHSVPTEF